ncbi:histidine triad (HIT) family protein [Lachnospiraceae bacterium XBB1006]|nr:histidine triad (HIT) family protein [Lachnospiraceae bacterium XBB1006]
MRKDDCIFCKIAGGEIPSRTVYEDELFRVIMDIEPAEKGHCLIIPKNHFDDLFTLGEEEATKMMPLAQTIATKMKDALSCDGLNIVQNNGEAANQTVKHFHLHLIPRYIGDHNQEKLIWNHAEVADAEMDEIFSKLK